MAFPLTEEQKRIVDDRGGELLVSAAAGSGKTRVLVERLMDRVTREGLDLDQFLVITYTRAAAGELRARIAQELSARLAEAPTTGTSAGRPPWSIRRRSPPFTPSVQPSFGRAGTCWIWTRTSACATRGRAM
ncbi:MAG: UvrD-helicase domain-containing protein [Lawsonibacter sp.]